MGWDGMGGEGRRQAGDGTDGTGRGNMGWYGTVWYRAAICDPFFRIQSPTYLPDLPDLTLHVCLLLMYVVVRLAQHRTW